MDESTALVNQLGSTIPQRAQAINAIYDGKVATIQATYFGDLVRKKSGGLRRQNLAICFSE